MSGVRTRSLCSEAMALTPKDERTKAQLPELQGIRRALSRRARRPLVPHAGPTDGEQTTGGGKSGTLRAAIFGVNDGLVSNVSLIMGFAGASQPRSVILLAGISGLIAGACSMGAGEYLSMRIQRDVLERMLHLEAHELGTDPEGEEEELAAIYRDKGIPAPLATEVAKALMREPGTALDAHAREELGIDPDVLGSPWGAAISSFVSFSAGAFVPLIPFLFTGESSGALLSAVVAGLTLLVVGAITSRFTGRAVAFSALRMFAIGMGAAAVTFGIGLLLGVSVVG
jgi:vacuolar iron transporter family protein